MPEVTKSSIEDVRLGTRLVGSLRVGMYELYVRFEKRSYNTPGSFSFTLPYWASGYGVVLSGGGGGGQAGDGAFGSNGRGGQGGDVVGIWGRMTSSFNRTLSIVIGAGGAGGTSSTAYGKDGGTTSITIRPSNTETLVYSAAGGSANPTMSSQAGGLVTRRFSEPQSLYLDMSPNTLYPNGPAGTGNGGSGTLGGGGAGGNGGVFNNYTNGGKGGNGFVHIYVWGLPRH